ncbi:HSP20-like chaperone, partial [Panus rudis PR-1116 ss-1]
LDIVEDLSSNTTTISIDTPGIRKEDIDLSIVANTLTVLAKRERANTGSSGRQVVREEKAYGVFERKLALPAGTQVRDLKAHLANGVLTVSYPRTSEHAPEKVAISSD